MNFQHFNKSFSFIAKCNRVYFSSLISRSALVQMQTFKLQDFIIRYGSFEDLQDVNLKYILNLEPDRLLATYLIDIDLPIKKDRYGNLENIRFDGKIWDI
ncbi:hypothetical protein [Mariniflexile sp. HMF6888]|uniref:hypothetical protein n=1 Tax=Mariniflexile sp. HMF6888 TaxID=3373086 RepID=UPI0037A8C7AF